MTTGPASFQELPAPLKIGVILAGGGGLMAAVGALASAHPWLAGIVVCGIIGIGVLLVLYAQLLKWQKARKAKPMEHQMFRGAGASQQGISDPQQLAIVDDLRRKFEEGIATFRAAGKSLYSLPWHVILGEPGSGKTEAIKHCGIGFPPGLNDPYRGTGGTINMDWWFTDHGVLIDTAGKLMFEEAHSGGSRQWREFLNLLRKWRRDCPINGALLAIPADSLICDNAEEIERKAGQIAQQFDMIQRTLDVRFPVYVVITKSDLINGFREFFANIADPQLQHQILGWSNPGDMDKPYDPSFVDKYLEDMKTRLFRTRLTRLGELRCDDSDEEDRPTAEAMYAFPLAFEQLGPRLRRYLDLIFNVGSQWSCKPLFFRGIYFTSSMQEGAALDEDLAQALGVPVGSLPEGPVWKRDRAHFLRDLFLSKVFPERGLVTRATSARKQYARRQAAVLGAAASGLLLLLALTIYGGFTFARSVRPVEKLLKVAVSPDHSIAIIDPRSNDDYVGHLGLRANGEPERGLPPRYRYFADLTEQAAAWQEGKGIPRVFRPGVALMTLEPNDAARRLYVSGVLQPLLRVAADTMKQDDGAQMETRAKYEALYESLCQFLALRATDSFDARPGFAPLLKYAYPEEYGEYPDHAEALMKPADALGALAPWNDTLTREDVDKAIENGIELFNRYWPRFSPKDNTRLTEIQQAVEHCRTFESAERKLIGIAKEPNREALAEWVSVDFPTMQTAKRLMDADKGVLTCVSLQSEWELQVTGPRKDAESRYGTLLTACGTDANRPDSRMYKHFQRLRVARDACLLNLKTPAFALSLDVIDSQFWRGASYQSRFSLYETAVNCTKVLQGQGNITLEKLPDIMTMCRTSVEKARADITDELRKLNPRPYGVTDANGAAQVLLRYGEQQFHQSVVEWGLRSMPSEKAKVGSLIENKTGQSYDPNMTRLVYSAWRGVREAADGLDSSQKKSKDELVARDSAYRGHAEEYVKYWQGEGGRQKLEALCPRASDWEAWYSHPLGISERPANKFLRLSNVGKELTDNQTSIKGYADSKTVEEFQKKWQLLENKDKRDIYTQVLANWVRLGPGPQEARQKLLTHTPTAVEFRNEYFVSTPRPAEASPDYYWYHLAFTSLELLVGEMKNVIDSSFTDVSKSKFPLKMEDSGSNDLTLGEVQRIYEVSQKWAERVSADPSGAGGRTGDKEIDGLGLFQTLCRGPVLPPWVEKIDVLPVAIDKYRYGCYVNDIKTNPPGRIRRIDIKKGAKTVTCENRSGTDVWKNDKGVVCENLDYDCSNDHIELAFYNLPREKESRQLKVTPVTPTSFRGPWVWHRMVKNVEPNDLDGSYGVNVTVDLAEEDNGPAREKNYVTIVMKLQFFRVEKARPGKQEPLRIFPR